MGLHDGVGWRELESELLVVATGARESVPPFPGWTLPGVMTAGAAQRLAKVHGVAPGRRVVVAGSGPLLPLVANELVRRGARVMAVLEGNPAARWLRRGLPGWGDWDRFLEGMDALRLLRMARVPYRTGSGVIRAEGSGALEAVVVARLDAGGSPVPGSEKSIPVDTLCLGFGFVPNTEVTQLAGCAHDFHPERGGWVPRTVGLVETTVPFVFVAGEAGGIAGAKAAMGTGHVAALIAAGRLGRLGNGELTRAVRRCQRGLGGELRFAARLNALVRPGTGQDALVADDTILCRCQRVSAGEVRRAVAQGARQLDALKLYTRVGQGLCQGRTCGPGLARFIARETVSSEEAAGFFHVRPPLRPVRMGDLVAIEGK
jgi:NADPH-dependent 2,4-dienoyl-CoA reductase/sulfur reductase-like enzyme